MPSRRDPAPWVLFLLACAERLAFLFGSRDRAWPFPIFYEGDAEAFHDFAQAILHGASYDGGIPFHPPGFPLLLAALQTLAGDPARHLLIRALLGVASAAVPVMLYILLRRPAGRGAALAAGLIAALSFGLDALGVSATSEGLYILLTLGLLLVAIAPAREGRAGIARAAILGAGTGALALTRAEGILLGASIAIVWLAPLLRAPSRRKSTVLAAAAIGLVLSLAPWTIRNAVRLTAWNERTGRSLGVALPTFVPLTAYGPLNFALANNDSATGEFQRKILTSRAETAVLDLRDPQHRHYFLHGTGEGLRWIAAHPGRFASLVGRKLAITVRAFDLGWLPWNLPLGRTGTRLPVDLFHPASSGLWLAQLLLAVAGGAILLRARGGGRVLLLLALPVATAFLATVLFFGYVRLGMTAAPSIFALEGIAIAAIAARLPGAWRLRIARPVVWMSLAVALLALLVYAGLEKRDYTASGSTDRPGGMLQRDASMQITPLRR